MTVTVDDYRAVSAEGRFEAIGAAILFNYPVGSPGETNESMELAKFLSHHQTDAAGSDERYRYYIGSQFIMAL
jgi:hypothetical protein